MEVTTGAEHRTIVSNASVFLTGQVLGLVAPLLTVPYLARTLGPSGWAPVLMAQGLGYWLITILEFAFDLSGTRAVARSRVVAQSTASVVHGVQSAKVLLSLVTIPAALVVCLALPILRTQPALVAGTLAFALLRGLSPLWYFQGVERVHGAIAVESLTKVAAAVAVFFLVRTPDQGWRVLGLQAVFAAVSLVWLTALLSRETGLQRPDLRSGWRTLRENFAVFTCRVSAGLYVQANTLILGAIAPASVAFFGGAERIVRAAINLLYPLNQAVMPRISFLQATNPNAADEILRRSFLALGGIGAVMTLTAFTAAPLLVHVLLGGGYDSAILILRVLSPLPLLTAINGVLGIFWALPLGLERRFLAAILAGGATNLLLTVVLVPRFAGIGMAISSVAAEVAVFAVLMRAYVTRS